MNPDMGRDMVTLYRRSRAVVPSTRQTEVVAALSANMRVADMVLPRCQRTNYPFPPWVTIPSGALTYIK
jgi:hypothetical protein